MKKTIAIIGGGPAGLMLAAQLDEEVYDITIYERNFAPGRKFLVAGKGGFNLTHGESPDSFINRYTPSSFLQQIISSFSNTDLRSWLASIGIETYVGSSNRVFPVKGIKPIEVLNAILTVLKHKNVRFQTQYCWQGWSDPNKLLFSTDNGIEAINADITVFALGGGSWKKTGSDGNWLNYFAEKNVETLPFQASNCGFKIEWPKTFISQFEGKPIKNISIKCLDKEKRGEVVITSFGIEGGAIYSLSPEIRKQLNSNKEAFIYFDLKPDIEVSEIIVRLKGNRGNASWTKHIEDQLKLSKVQLALLKSYLSKDDFVDPEKLAYYIKGLPLSITELAPLDEAISTVGGISLNEIDQNLQLKKLPNHYAIGEMLDWDAPTGGYLLQACFSMGYGLAQYINSIK